MKKKYYIIYKTTNTKNGRFYIGQHKLKNKETTDLWYYGSGLYIKNAKNKYKKQFKDIFKREILEFCFDKVTTDAREIFYISKNKHDKLCVNISKGGSGGNMWMYKSDHSKHIFKIKMRNIVKGRVLSKKSRINISLGKKGSKNPNYGKKICQGISHKGKDNGHYGKKRINKNGVNKSVCEKDIDNYLKDGWLMGMVKKLAICPHCGKSSYNRGLMTRYHFDNCKLKSL